MIIKQVTSKEEAEKAMIALGQEIIRRAQSTCMDIDRVTSIKINAEIEPFPDGALSVDITKKYITEFEEGKNEEF